MIIDLAARGYLTIKEIPSKSLVLVQRGLSVHARQGLRRPQTIRVRSIHAKLFEGKNEVLMSELTTKFYPVIGRGEEATSIGA